MGNFYIVTNTNCGPCIAFKNDGLLFQFVKFLFDNIQNINVFWYEYNPTNGITNTFEFVDENNKQKVQINSLQKDAVMKNIIQFPQGVYQINNGEFVDEVLTINDPREWKNILNVISNNPDSYQVFSSNDGYDDMFNNENYNEKSVNRRKSPIKRSSPNRSNSKRKASPNRKWSRMK